MFLLSSAKVSLTNMGPRAKPKLFSVSLTQNFQRGRQVCKQKGEGLLGPRPPSRPLFIWEVAPDGALLPATTSRRPLLTQGKLF